MLNRDFASAKMKKNRVWTTGITCIWTLQSWVYLAMVIDLYSRQMGWLVSGSPDGTDVGQSGIDDGHQSA